MPQILIHRNVRIVTLQKDESIADHCKAGDIAILEKPDGWWTCFVDDDGDVSEYDEPFPAYNKALWTAKAAAEFQGE